MEILDNREQWLAEFETGWLKHHQETGEKNWRIYNLPRNESAPPGRGIDLAHSRLMLISSAGGYLKGEQTPFDDKDPYGDYSVRVFPINTPSEKIDFSHPAYDKTNVITDHQVLLPLGHLRDMEAEGIIGELVPNVVSFMGYQPVVTRLVDESVPAMMEIVEVEQPDAVLLVPSWPLCTQSVGLIARAIEMNGIATTLTSWNGGRTRVTMPPRATFTRLVRGSTLGRPHDEAQQRRVLEATLALLREDAPINPVTLNETFEETEG